VPVGFIATTPHSGRHKHTLFLPRVRVNPHRVGGPLVVRTVDAPPLSVVKCGVGGWFVWLCVWCCSCGVVCVTCFSCYIAEPLWPQQRLRLCQRSWPPCARGLHCHHPTLREAQRRGDGGPAPCAPHSRAAGVARAWTRISNERCGCRWGTYIYVCICRYLCL